MSEANKSDLSDRDSGTCPQNQSVPGITRFNEEQQESGGAHGRRVLFRQQRQPYASQRWFVCLPVRRHSFLYEVLTREQMPAQLDRFTCYQSQGGTCPVAKTMWVAKYSLTTAWGALAAIYRGSVPRQRRVAVIRPCQRSLNDPRPHHTHARRCASWRRLACL